MDEKIEREDKVVKSQEAWEEEQSARIERMTAEIKTALVEHRLVKISQELTTRVIEHEKSEAGKFRSEFARDLVKTFVVDTGVRVAIEAETVEELRKKIEENGL